MSITGYYDGTSIRIKESLQINQKVIVIPIENELDFEETAAGGLHEYANPALIKHEKDMWRKAVVKKHGGE